MPFFARAAVMAALLFLISGLAAAAQDVSLRSHDGSVELAGSLIGFDGEFYRIDTIFGPLTVSAEGVNCRGPGCPDLENFVAEIRFAGAAAITEQLFPALIERFADSRDYTLRRQILDANRSVFMLIRADGGIAGRFFVTGTSTDAGLAALLGREADIALATRQPDPGEAAAARAADQGDISMVARSRIMGLDALVPLVAPGNTIDALSLQDLARIFAGEISSWQDLGGPDAPIALHLMDVATGQAQDVETRVLTPFDLTPLASITRHASTADLADAVAQDPFAIGIGNFSEIGNARLVPLRGLCGFRQPATTDSIKTEDYPLTAPMFVYLPVRRMPQLGRDFLTFFDSQEADRVIRRLGFVNQAVTAQPLGAQGERLANAVMAAGAEVDLGDLQDMVTAMSGAERLSPTFRFGDGTSELDAYSLSAVARLARAIERGAYDGRELVFAGFSDGQGGADANLRLARGRAEAVRLAIIAAASGGDLNRVRLRVDAFGEALPMACDDTAAGRAVNRRVEVWLR
jgi:phosphate transport system substrate-binding protein